MWRPVPGFTPAEGTFNGSRDQMDLLRTEFAQAVHLQQQRADTQSEGALRLCTVVVSGLISQQSGQSSGVGYGAGIFSSLTDTAFGLFFARYADTGGSDTDSRP